MKRSLLLLLSGALLLTSCHSTGEGAVVGGNFGYILGSAIGGITGGGRGHDWGALIGTVSGAAAGAAIGASSEKAREERYRESTDAGRRQQSRSYDHGSGYDERESPRYDGHGGGVDDRVDFGLGYGPSEPPLEIRNAVIVDDRRDGVLTRGEECTVRFEVFNTSAKPVFDVMPIVGEMTGNKHIKISPNLHIKSIGPYKGVRYKATIKAGRRLKDGEIKVVVGVSAHSQTVNSQTRYFSIPTARGER